MRRSMLAVGVSTVALAAATACGTSGTSELAAAAASRAPSTSTAQISDLAQLASAMSTNTKAKKTVHIQLQSTQITGTGQAQYGNPVKTQMTVTVQGQQMQIVYINTTFYMESSLFSQETGGKPWVKIDPNSTGPLSKVLGTVAKTMQQNADPGQSLAMLKGSDTLAKTTPEQLDGQPVTHYSITVDVAKFAAEQTDPALKQIMEQAVKSGMTSYPMDYWVNSDDLPVKFVVKQPTAPGQTVTMTTTYTAWGQPVNIQAPPASQVGTLPGA